MSFSEINLCVPLDAFINFPTHQLKCSVVLRSSIYPRLPFYSSLRQNPTNLPHKTGMNKKLLKIVQSAMLANKITLQKVSDFEKHEK